MSCQCKDCTPPTRHPGCHDKCEKWILWEAEKEKKKEYDKQFKYNCFSRIAPLVRNKYRRMHARQGKKL